MMPSRFRKQASQKESLRDAANVIADAVTTAKDVEIAEIKDALLQARAEGRIAMANLSFVSLVGMRILG
jgi:hypothetical protein